VANLYFFPEIVQVLIVDWLPWIEVVLGLLLVTGTVIQAASLASCVLVVCFMFQNGWMIMNGYKNEPCFLLRHPGEDLPGTALDHEFALYRYRHAGAGAGYLLSVQRRISRMRPWFMRLPSRAARAPEPTISP